MHSSASFASSEPLARKAFGMPLRVSRLRTAWARTEWSAAITTTSRRFATSLRDHSWTNSAIVRWNSSSRMIHGFST